MSARKLSGKRTWIEIDRSAVRHNIGTFRKLIGPRVKLWAVVKSNAYGHGLITFAKLADQADVDGFCVDSLVEGLALRREGIKAPILVLGSTLKELLSEAARHDIMLSVSNFDALKAITGLQEPPKFHLKIDTGMHRQGFYLRDLPKVIDMLTQRGVRSPGLAGLCTHFAAAKDILYPTVTERQFQEFEQAAKLFRKAGFRNLTNHVSATGGTLLNKKYHLDAVRVGIGLYGLWPSAELAAELASRITLKPVLSWRSIISELKVLESGEAMGYDLAETVHRRTTLAIVPVGYWHGYPRALSSSGEVLVRGRRAKVLGRVSMDMIAIDVTDCKARVNDVVILVEHDAQSPASLMALSQKLGASHYEVMTRLNPLIERVVV